MADAVISFLSGGSDTKSKVIRAVASMAKDVSPIVRTIQAGHGLFKLGDGISNVASAAQKLGDAGQSINRFVPSMQVMGQSMCDSVKIFAAFSSIATTVGIGTNIIRTYQGMQVLQLIAERLKDISTSMAAQTALIAQKEFPHYVYDMISERLMQTTGDPSCDHWFFLWHPDDDWYPKFFHLLQDKPFGPRFCGYTNQIDSVFVFMIAVRRRIKLMEHKAIRRGQPIRPVRLHLLVPAYQPVLIAEALKIPDEIGDFVIEGRINSNREFVWLNLPADQRHYVMNVGQWDPPPVGWVNWAMTKAGLADKPPELREPRVLGTRQQDLLLAEEEHESCDDRDASSIRVELGSQVGGSETGLSRVEKSDIESGKSQATPLHHRSEKKHRRKRRQ
ncbi:hypothetical protein PT974_09748 [Cladobotryum mycophilum]|uniref:Uncharacterized protein n=1 Tax=Cladobotryum mycophilum TaxID=491253 RepID=A0ABR0SH45_9HYPO